MRSSDSKLVFTIVSAKRCERLEVGTGGVECGGHAGGSASDDDEFFHKQILSLLTFSDFDPVNMAQVPLSGKFFPEEKRKKTISRFYFFQIAVYIIIPDRREEHL